MSEEKNQSAKDIAKIMVENMKANMKDPDFFNKKERRMQEARYKVLKERKNREEKQQSSEN
ncbi:MAG: hypothetical protein ACFFAS_04420 [Promethearchaeota archaeon]